MAAELGVDVPRATALVALSDADLSDPDLARALRGAGPLDPRERLLAVTGRLAVLLRGPAFDAAAVDLVRAEPDLLDLGDVTAPTVDSVRRAAAFRALAGTGDPAHADLRTVLAAWGPATGFATADPATLGRVLGVEAAVAASLVAHVVAPAAALDGLRALARAAEIAATLGVDGG